jgi:hypothetical protein
MKRIISLALSVALMCGLVFNNMVSADTSVRPTVVLAESGFENGLEDPFLANASDAGAQATVTHISLEGEANGYMHVSERTEGQRSATAQQNILAKLKENGADGKYYISARIKLDNPEDTAYVAPFIQGAKLQMQPGGGERFEVSGSWSEVGKKSDGSFMEFSTTVGTWNQENLDAETRSKFYFMLYTAPTGHTTYDGSYSIDDVVLWFVPNDGAPASVTEIGESILVDGDFEANIANPDAYNGIFSGDDTWYVATADGSGAAKDRLCKLTVETESSSANAKYVHSGKGALHITNRPGAHQSIAINMKDIISEVGPLAPGEGYYMSVWMRAEDGETIKVQPIFGASTKGSGFIVGGDFTTVTDEWTEVGILNDGTYSMFKTDSGGFFDPYGGAWANIRLRTEGTESFYVDDFKVMGPQKPGDAVVGFVQGVNSLPEPAQITHANEAAIILLENTYAEIDQTVLTDEQKAELASAKAKLDAARAAFNALPAPKNSFQPVFDFKDKANLIAPYGDLESFTENDFVWNEENTENGTPKYTLITDKDIAHSGNNCLLISGREKTQHGAAFTLTDVVKQNGGGKYYFSAWMRTKNPGEVMDVFPLLYIGGLGMEFYINGDERYTITNEWTFVGVTYDNVEGYYRSNGQEIPDLDEKATYVALRFYGQNETLESADDGVMFPDYYIDDLKVWKYFEGQEDYVDPDAPKETETTDPTTGDNDPSGNNGNPKTGHPFSTALPVLSAAGLGGVLLGKRRKK